MNMGLGYEARILHAAADGVGPALMLSAPKGAAQYLINVPEGFARLALEHKLRPSSHLSCVLLTSLLPKSAGGLGGLFLRLAQDGHGQVQMVGPEGSAHFGHSFRHIFRWRHPKVLVSECGASKDVPVFEDEYIVIVPIVADDLSLGCPWCRYASTAKVGEVSLPCTGLDIIGSSSHSDTTDSDSESLSPIASAGKFDQSDDMVTDCKDSAIIPRHHVQGNFKKHLGLKDLSYSRNCGEAAVANETSNSKCVGDGLEREGILLNYDGKDLEKRRNTEFLTTSVPLFSELDNIFGSSIGRSRGMRKVALSRLKEACGNASQLDSYEQKEYVASPADPLGWNVGEASQGSHQVYQKGLESSETAITLEKSYGQMLRSTSAVVASKPTHAMDQPFSSLGRSLLTRHPLPAYKWLINNAPEIELPDLADDVNPVYVRTQCGTIGPVESVETHLALEKENTLDKLKDGIKSSKSTVLGFVCFLKKLHTGVIVVDCKTPELLESFWLHPVLSCVHRLTCSPSSQRTEESAGSPEWEGSLDQGLHSVAAVIHLSPCSVEQAAGYSKVLAEQIGKPAHIVVRTGSCNFGFCSSLETLVKLNVINRQMFPLPYNVVSNFTRNKEVIEVVDAKKPLLEASILTRVLFERSPSGVQTLLDHSECAEALNIKEIQDVLLQSKPQLQAAIVEGKARGLDPSIEFKSGSTANQIAAVSLKEKLMQRKKMVKLNKSLTNSIHGYSKHEPTDLDRGVAAGINCNERAIPDGVGDHISSESNLFSKSCSKLHSSVEESRTGSHVTGGSEFELVFLGTGSAEPSKFRGSSGILLRIGGWKHAMLLDSGEGALGQLIRKFGVTGASEVLMTLDCVWLSHKHADHVLGILSLIYARPMGARMLTIIGPSAVKRWIYEVVSIWATMDLCCPAFQFVPCDTLIGGLHSKGHGVENYNKAQVQKILQHLELDDLTSVAVDHCHEAYGLVVHGKRGWTIVYSGDTRPCQRLVQAGAGCTLLIHEATFEGNLADHAKRKRHSTVPEALDIGRQMGAQYILLTHFSQRYPQVVNMNTVEHKNVCLAFDGMVVRSSDLSSFGCTLPLLALAFTPFEHSNVQLCPDSNFEVSTDGIPFQENTEKQPKLIRKLENRAYKSHFLDVLNDQRSTRSVEAPNCRVTKMKGFTSSFNRIEREVEAECRIVILDSDSSRHKKGTHIRFASSDSDSDGAPLNLQSPCKHTRWKGSDDEFG